MYTPSALTTKQVAKFLWRDKFYFKNPNITFHPSQESVCHILQKGIIFPLKV